MGKQGAWEGGKRARLASAALDLGDDAQEIAAPELENGLLGKAAVEHELGDLRRLGVGWRNGNALAHTVIVSPEANVVIPDKVAYVLDVVQQTV